MKRKKPFAVREELKALFANHFLLEETEEVDAEKKELCETKHVAASDALMRLSLWELARSRERPAVNRGRKRILLEREAFVKGGGPFAVDGFEEYHLKGVDIHEAADVLYVLGEHERRQPFLSFFQLGKAEEERAETPFSTALVGSHECAPDAFYLRALQRHYCVIVGCRGERGAELEVVGYSAASDGIVLNDQQRFVMRFIDPRLQDRQDGFPRFHSTTNSHGRLIVIRSWLKVDELSARVCVHACQCC